MFNGPIGLPARLDAPKYPLVFFVLLGSIRRNLTIPPRLSHRQTRCMVKRYSLRGWIHDPAKQGGRSFLASGAGGRRMDTGRPNRSK